ncbi:MAG TPA: NUDIX hydrolase N-terminal domain-containing protein [Acidimicrobiia bacterium]|nr:NUDIX hydrolase N-terminal domain-containing protein [Acidimicrobiia bacterium]
MTTRKLLDLIQRLAATAETGMSFATGEFDRRRYQEVARIAAELAHFGESELATIRPLFQGDGGYITPKLIVRAAVFSQDRILMVREVADGLWTIPGGWIDVGESPALAAEREVAEETGLRVSAYKLAAVYDKRRHPHPDAPYHAYLLFFLCRLEDEVGDDAWPGDGLETSEVGWFAASGLPALSRGRATDRQILRMFDHHREPSLPTDFD